MLSGNGRHRRPRQAPAILVAAGVTGSAIAIPLLGASAASAADGTAWDKVAECETGGAWSQNDGNGFYGGLKLSQDDWDKYGGLDYASRPDLASRNQQIAVAEKILDDQGVGAFHTCGLTSGLTEDSGSDDIDTGVLDGGSSGSSDSSGSYGSSGLSNSPGGTTDESSSYGSSDSSGSSDASSGASSSASPSASPDRSDDSAKSDTSASPSSSSPDATPSGSRRGDNSPAERAKGDDSDNSEQAVGSWSLVDTGALGSGRHRGASADETPAGSHADDTYTVRAGDTLASIADSLGLDGGWRALYDANKKAIGADPNHIFAGQTLRLSGE
ncbi:transglycosylase family protein [Streptomyces sp. NBC_00588]|uniref:transglycosylase family protein n=1 Tax=Streptomyces sp. NBC_00588 TaxID=2975784 RepID=UPI002E821DCB|nr:transglycosylase family protein [Streptomyces sp. NBC_00588]WUB36442.1 LysM peptidoglycan-binding domain-containing protein [Streptomyces sp. NBC_00588]